VAKRTKGDTDEVLPVRQEWVQRVTHREAYREIRALMWAFFVDNAADRSCCSDKPSN
jgi:hypothetical protein